MDVPVISVEELAELASSPERPYLLDVREPHEREISVLGDDHHIRMSEVPARLAELDAEADIVVYCRTGGRSGQVAEYLIANGFPRVRNLEGGINAWATRIDRTLPVY